MTALRLVACLVGAAALSAAPAFAHTAGLSQGSYVVDAAPDGPRVQLELVFARGESARLDVLFVGRPLVDVRADGVACPVSLVADEPIEEDGRALRLEARCPQHGAVVVDVVGLAALDARHRHSARVLGARGERSEVLTPAAHHLVVDSGPSSSWRTPSVALAASFVVLLVVLMRAGDRHAVLRSVGAALIGAAAGALFGAPPLSPAIELAVSGLVVVDLLLGPGRGARAGFGLALGLLIGSRF